MKAQSQRLERIAKLKALLIKANGLGKALNQEKVIAELSCVYGVARRTALEYIDSIVNTGYATMEFEDGEKCIRWRSKQTIE
jgi:hypothetical protein